MKDPIERQDAIDALKKHEIELSIYAPRETDVFWDDAIDCCVSEIEALPSAQPEIIRCKDCKFWKKYGYINGKPEFLPKCGFNQIYTSKDDFCSRAER